MDLSEWFIVNVMMAVPSIKHQYLFDGIDDYGTIPPVTLEGDFEISMYATSSIDSTGVTLGDAKDSNTWGFYRYIGSNTTYVRLGYRDGTWLDVSYNGVAPLGVGVEYKVSRIGTVASFFIDGELVGTSSSSIKPVIINRVGARGTGGTIAINHWNGNIRDVYFNDLSNPSNSRLYKINEGSGAKVMIDSLSSDSSRNGVYNNFNNERWGRI